MDSINSHQRDQVVTSTKDSSFRRTRSSSGEPRSNEHYEAKTKKPQLRLRRIKNLMSKRKPKKFTPKEITIRGRKLWQIYLGSEVRKHPDGRRVRVPKRKTFASHAEANQYAELLRIQRANHGTAAMRSPASFGTMRYERRKSWSPFLSRSLFSQKNTCENKPKSAKAAISGPQLPITLPGPKPTAGGRDM